jgi:DNA-binding SARP family transcriptional activator/tetratricopeptide (TPR) repeat protein
VCRVRFRLLGPVTAERNGQTLQLRRAHTRGLLAYLLLHSGQPISRDALTEALWGGAQPSAARSQLPKAVGTIRRALADLGLPDAIQSGPYGYLAVVDLTTVDAIALEEGLRAARAADATGVERACRLRAALAEWGAEPLQDAAGSFVEAARARLVELRLTAVEELADVELALGGAEALTPKLAELVAAHPLRERLRARYMAVLFHSGRKSEALLTFRAYRNQLAAQEGLDPGREILDLQAAILRDDGPAPMAARPAPAPTLLAPAPPLGPAPPVVPAPAGSRARPAQLPLTLHGFTGRVAQLERLDAMATTSVDSAATLIITGMPGVGKTTLAVRWAHRVVERFPDGQLYVNLRGFDPGAAMTPGEAIRGLLGALGVAAERVPLDVDGQAAHYRSLLDGKRILVVLDNARDAAQVRPLLPGAPGCLAVVTSRNRLSSLVAVEGARTLALDLLDPGEATELLAGRIGAARLAAEPQAVGAIVTATARLPLALALVAARAVGEPSLPLSALAADLSRTRGGLDALSVEDEATDMRSVLSWSYRALTPAAARLFRLLGCHPGADISTPAAASLAGSPLDEIAELLGELQRAHLVTEHVPGRYRGHDLLRAYATELVEAPGRADERREAVHRVLDHYAHTANAAAPLLGPKRERFGPEPPVCGVTPEVISDPEQAWTWFTAEQQVLVAAIRRSAADGLDAYTWRLTNVSSGFLDRRGRWDEVVELNLLALDAATRLGETRAAAYSRRMMAGAYVRRARFDDAVPHIEAAIALYESLGDHGRIASMHRVRSYGLNRRGRYREALAEAMKSLDLYRLAGDRFEEASVINNIAFIHGLLGDHQKALEIGTRALAMIEELGNRDALAWAWDTLGRAHRGLGEHDRAIECHQKALAIHHKHPYPVHEGEVWSNLGDAYRAAGRLADAQAAWLRSLEILAPDHPVVPRARASLAALPALELVQLSE